MKAHTTMIVFFYRWISTFIPLRNLIGIFFLHKYFLGWIRYKLASKQPISLIDSYPCLTDWVSSTPFDPHYFYQGAWLARKLANAKPDKHVDIGSSVLTMSVLSATVDTVFVDYRPLKVSLPGLTSIAGDILCLPFEDNSVSSLSCLHVIEHIGLGRYGDPIDPAGSIKASAELQRIVSRGGKLFVSVPIGRERVCFNAHRVHAPASVIEMFPELKLVEFSYVDDNGQFFEVQSVDSGSQFEYGCGLFQFEKP
jgi:hypothetical protein